MHARPAAAAAGAAVGETMAKEISQSLAEQGRKEQRAIAQTRLKRATAKL